MWSTATRVVGTSVVVTVSRRTVVHQSLDTTEARAHVHTRLCRAQTQVVTQPERGHGPRLATRVAPALSALSTDDRTLVSSTRTRSTRLLLECLMSRLIGDDSLMMPRHTLARRPQRRLHVLVSDPLDVWSRLQQSDGLRRTGDGPRTAHRKMHPRGDQSASHTILICHQERVLASTGGRRRAPRCVLQTHHITPLTNSQYKVIQFLSKCQSRWGWGTGPVEWVETAGRSDRSPGYQWRAPSHQLHSHASASLNLHPITTYSLTAVLNSLNYFNRDPRKVTRHTRRLSYKWVVTYRVNFPVGLNRKAPFQHFDFRWLLKRRSISSESHTPVGDIFQRK